MHPSTSRRWRRASTTSTTSSGRMAGAWVFRVNIGTQIQRDDQILYEYRALRLLENTGVTPRPFYVDDSREHLDYGVLLMEYLPGGKLDYRRDLEAAARLFARVHSAPVPADDNPLIREDRPLTMTYEECARLLPVYLESESGGTRPARLSARRAGVGRRSAPPRTRFRRRPVVLHHQHRGQLRQLHRQPRTRHAAPGGLGKPLYGDPSKQH